jgi:hypothetical protein
VEVFTVISGMTKKNPGRLARTAAFSPVLLTLLGCGLFDAGIEICVILPAAPSVWLDELGELRFSLVYPGWDGRLTRTEVMTAGSPVRVSCSKRGNSPVLAYPWCAGAGSAAAFAALRPAGGLFPRDLRQGAAGLELVLSWEDGAAAEVFRALFEGGIDTELVNGDRLARLLEDTPDPWEWNLESIVSDIAEGDFTAYDIDRLPSRDVRLPAPQGAWFMESPFYPVLATGPDGRLFLESLTFGLHHLFGGGRRMDVFLDARGASTVPAGLY